MITSRCLGREPELTRPGACFSNVPVTFRTRKTVLCLHSRSSFNNFENNTMELSVIETIWTALWARNCANIQQVLILKFAFGPEKFSGSFEKWAPDPRGWQKTSSCHLRVLP